MLGFYFERIKEVIVIRIIRLVVRKLDRNLKIVEDLLVKTPTLCLFFSVFLKTVLYVHRENKFSCIETCSYKLISVPLRVTLLKDLLFSVPWRS